AQQCSTEFCSGSRFTNDKGARRAYIHDIEVAQFPSEDAGTEDSVPAHIDPSEENNESHLRIMKKNAERRYSRLRLQSAFAAQVTKSPDNAQNPAHGVRGLNDNRARPWLTVTAKV